MPGAQGLVQTLKDLLTRDEHVVSLARGLQEAQLEAFTMLTDAVEPATPRLLSRAPSVLPLVEQPDTENSRRGIGLQDATALFDAVTTALASDPDLVLDIDWRLHPRGESAS
ncbi:MAG TPA: hypothetical protein VI542_22830 [Candidatus Tectomicrobia bacterium]